MIAILFFIFGGCIGSFLNVCIYRIPQNASIILPRSFCPQCKTPLKFYHNVPIISYIALKAKCPFCKGKIFFTYIMVELLSAVFALLYFFKFGFSTDFVFFFMFTSLLIIISFIDVKDGIIPSFLTLPFILIGFAFSFVFKTIKPLDSFFGIITGALFFIFIALIYKAATKKEGMGRGDIKLLATIGAFIGFKGVLFTVVASSLLGSVVGIILFVFINKRQIKISADYIRFLYKNSVPLPFAPFLSVGAVAYIFWGETLIDWYLNLFNRFI